MKIAVCLFVMLSCSMLILGCDSASQPTSKRQERRFFNPSGERWVVVSEGRLGRDVLPRRWVVLFDSEVVGDDRGELIFSCPLDALMEIDWLEANHIRIRSNHTTGYVFDVADVRVTLVRMDALSNPAE